jgi:hypothetical protein
MLFSTGAARCILERLAEEHFFHMRSRCHLAPQVEENIAWRAVYFCSTGVVTFTASKYGAPVEDSLRRMD